ncbi:unnamed protein product [Microthlaspi erraticum]|uniref:Uncharacterized protein n=1 Tax=Microthlaspi erraticum TaxID=1685480 RepID=A0A6D2J735_9BRAS|nr:unnamed protein product [Microthlaspi erraticum]
MLRTTSLELVSLQNTYMFKRSALCLPTNCCPEILKGFPLTPYITRYLPPFDEFEVDRFDRPIGKSTVLSGSPRPSVYLVIEGKGILQTGSSSQLLVN